MNLIFPCQTIESEIKCLEEREGERKARCKQLKKVEELLEEKQREIPQADKCMHMNEELKESRHTQPRLQPENSPKLMESV